MPSYSKPILLTFKMLALIAMTVLVGDRSNSATSSLLLDKEAHSYTTTVALAGDRELTALKQTVYDRINQYRANNNLPPLELNSQISQQAKIHSENMASGKVSFSHNGFEQRIQAIDSEITYRRAAENVAYNSGYTNPSKRAVEGWIDSRRHRQNILGNYNLTGIGIAKNQQGEYYFTQIFILE